MSYYGLEHPNPRGTVNSDGRYWGRRTRRAPASGAVVVHSTEGAPDYDPPDYGAENTARYFTHSTRPASYHRIVDSDTIVKFLPFDHEAYHDATGGNRYSVGVSFGTQAHTWGRDAHHDDAMLRNGARAIAEAARWWASLGQGRDPLDVARWITPGQYRNHEPGMVEHGQLDPSRRSDPWTTHTLRPALRDRLLSYVRDELGHDEPKEWDEMATQQEIADAVRGVVEEQVALGVMAITGDQFVPSEMRTADVMNHRDLEANIKAGVLAVGVQVIQQVGQAQGVKVNATEVAQAITDELARRLGA